MEKKGTLLERKSKSYVFWALLEKDSDKIDENLLIYKGQQYVYITYDEEVAYVVYFDISINPLVMMEDEVSLHNLEVIDDKDREALGRMEVRHITLAVKDSVIEDIPYEEIRKNVCYRDFPFKLVSSSKENSVFSLYAQIVNKIEEYLCLNPNSNIKVPI